jgi:hypothetical protein
VIKIFCLNIYTKQQKCEIQPTSIPETISNSSLTYSPSLKRPDISIKVGDDLLTASDTLWAECFPLYFSWDIESQPSLTPKTTSETCQTWAEQWRLKKMQIIHFQQLWVLLYLLIIKIQPVTIQVKQADQGVTWTSQTELWVTISARSLHNNTQKVKKVISTNWISPLRP